MAMLRPGRARFSGTNALSLTFTVVIKVHGDIDVGRPRYPSAPFLAPLGDTYA
jgi:hypothetical protein